VNFNDKRKYLILGLVALLTITNIITFSARAAAPMVQRCLTPIGKLEVAKKLSPKQLYQLLQMVGFKGRSLKIAWAVAMKETHGNPLAHDFSRRTGDDSYGVFQINLYGALKGRISEFGLKSAVELTNPVKNAVIAYQMSSGGKDWSPWHSNPGQRDHWLVVQWLKLYPQMV
jgi:Lysozyme like domain